MSRQRGEQILIDWVTYVRHSLIVHNRRRPECALLEDYALHPIHRPQVWSPQLGSPDLHHPHHPHLNGVDEDVMNAPENENGMRPENEGRKEASWRRAGCERDPGWTREAGEEEHLLVEDYELLIIMLQAQQEIITVPGIILVIIVSLGRLARFRLSS